MSEIEIFLLGFGVVVFFEVLVASLCYWQARRRGRDAVGWFLTGFFFSVPAVGVLLALPPIETPGQTKRCEGCGKFVNWRTTACPACGRSLEVTSPDPAVKVKRPLRSCFLYVLLFLLLLLIVLGFIGYFCVPDHPGPGSLLPESASNA